MRQKEPINREHIKMAFQRERRKKEKEKIEERGRNWGRGLVGQNFMEEKIRKKEYSYI